MGDVSADVAALVEGSDGNLVLDASDPDGGGPRVRCVLNGHMMKPKAEDVRRDIYAYIYVYEVVTRWEVNRSKDGASRPRGHPATTGGDGRRGRRRPGSSGARRHRFDRYEEKSSPNSVT